MQWYTHLVVWLVCLLLLSDHGSAVFVMNPTNVTTCVGSSAMFTCVINETQSIFWRINGQGVSSPPSTPLSSGPGQQSSLTVTGTSQLNGTSVQCFYLMGDSNVFSSQAYLSVQAPPSAPTNLTITTFNATSTNLVWVPPPNVQSPSLLSYGVEVRNGSGVVVYRGTGTVAQLIISTPDPCDLYEATVTAQYMIANLTCTGSSSSKLLGVSPSTVHFTTSLVFSKLSLDNVSVNMFVQYQSGVCFYKVVAISGSDVFPFPSVKPLPQYGGGQFNITISLPSNKYYNLIVTAFNGYGNISSVVVISTFGVIDISVNPSSPTGLVCVFNPGSLAIGCFVYLTDTSTGTVYCRVIARTLNRTVSVATCPSSSGPLSTGNYSVVVYTIESDGSLSPLAAISGKILNIYSTVGPSTVSQAPSSVPTTSNTALPGGIIGGVLGAVLGGLAIIIIIVIIIVVIILYVRNKQKQKPHSGSENVELREQGNYSEVKRNMDENGCEDKQTVSSERKQGAPDGQQRQDVQPHSTKSHYAVLNTEGPRPLTIPDEEKPVIYSETVGTSQRERNQVLEEKIKQLEEQVKKSDERRKKLEEREAARQKKIEDLEEEINDLNDEISELDTLCAEKDKEAVELANSEWAIALERRQEEIQAQIDEFEGPSDTLDEQMRETKIKIVELEQEKTELERQINEKRKDIDELVQSERATQQEEEIGNLREQIAALEEQKQIKESKLLEYREKLRRDDEEFDTLGQESEKLENQISKIQDQLDLRINTVSDEASEFGEKALVLLDHRNKKRQKLKELRNAQNWETSSLESDVSRD